MYQVKERIFQSSWVVSFPYLGECQSKWNCSAPTHSNIDPPPPHQRTSLAGILSSRCWKSVMFKQWMESDKLRYMRGLQNAPRGNSAKYCWHLNCRIGWDQQGFSKNWWTSQWHLQTIKNCSRALDVLFDWHHEYGDIMKMATSFAYNELRRDVPRPRSIYRSPRSMALYPKLLGGGSLALTKMKQREGSPGGFHDSTWDRPTCTQGYSMKKMTIGWQANCWIWQGNPDAAINLANNFIWLNQNLISIQLE